MSAKKRPPPPPPPRKKRDPNALLREHPRFPVDWASTLECPDWKTAERIAASNISKGGMFLRTTSAVPVGTKVQVTLILPDSREVKLQAVVRHCVTADLAARSQRPPGIGVEVEESCRNELQALVEIAKLRQDDGQGDVKAAAPASAPAPAPAPKRRPPPLPPPRPKATPVRLPRGKSADVVGIDLGVSYCSVAVAIGDTVFPVVDEKGRARLPSLVHLPETGDPQAGWRAREAQQRAPERTIASIKRILGRRYSDPHIAGFLFAAPYTASAGPGDSIVLEFEGATWATPQIAATILEHLTETAQRQLKRPISRAVLGHPVTFDQGQKSALLRAAAIAGIEVEDLIEEPVAAALAYGSGRDKNELVAVYDFGGGTFDFTVLQLVGESYRALVTEGDEWLGGDDFDLKLADALANAIWRKTSVDLRNSAVDWQRMLVAAERTKCELSAEESALFELPNIRLPDGEFDLHQKIERAAFERICLPLFESTLQVCQQALQSVGLQPAQVDQVIVIGGTSRIPFIRHGLERFFDRQISTLVNVDDAVALGTGLHAARFSQHKVRGARSLT